MKMIEYIIGRITAIQINRSLNKRNFDSFSFFDNLLGFAFLCILAIGVLVLFLAVLYGCIILFLGNIYG